MDTVFITSPYSQLRINEFYSLVNLIAEAAETMLTQPEAKAKIPALKEAVQQLDEAIKQSEKNKYTVSMELADKAVDEIWSCMWMITKQMVKHPNLERRATAADVYDLFYKYGNFTQLSYKEEYGKLTNLIQDLEATGADKLKLAQMDEWFEELKRRVAVFHQVDEERMKEEDARQVGIAKECRKQAEEALRTFLRYIDAFILLNSETGYTDFVARVNTLFAEAKTVVKSRRTKAANKKADETEGETTPPSSGTNLPPREPDPSIAPGLNDDPDDGSGDSESPDEI